MTINPVVTDLDEKIRVIFVPAKDFKTSQVTVSLLIPRTQNLAENIILSKYLSRVSKEYPTYALMSAKLESLYGASVSGSAVRKGESTRLEFTATFIDNRFALDKGDIADECLKLILEMLFNPLSENGKFSEKIFEIERRLAIQNIENEMNDKRTYALTRMIEVMCADEVFGITKAEILEELKKATCESAYEAWKELLKTATVQVNLIGNIDNGKACTLIKEKFASVDRKPAENTTVFVETAEDVTEKTEEMEINQSKLVLGFRSGMRDKDDSVYAETIMTDVFGGGPYSRLFSNVREKLSLCYYCSARIIKDKGIIVIQSGIEKENKQKVLDEIGVQLEIMKKGEFDNESLKASKTAICDSLRGVFDTPDGIDAFFGSRIGEDIISIDELIEKYENVTRQDVIAAANRMSLDTVYMLSGKENE